MAQGQLLGAATSAFNSAAQTQEGISDRAMKERVATDDRRSKQATDLLTTGINNYSAGRRQQAQQDVAKEMQQTELDAQFITLTPQMKKGAAEVTEDPSWNDIPDGFKMRADVYSSLLSVGTEMKRVNKPQLLEIQEGDQVYTAEYDPKTRKLTKKTVGGNRFSPDTRDGKKGGTQLNPFTLQNIVRQDEKTLLAQLGGKGKKGIPSASIKDNVVGGVKKFFGGNYEALNAEEKAKIGTLRGLAQRLKNNYQNLADLEESRGLSPTQMDPSTMEAIDALLGTGAEQPTPEGAPGTKIRVQAPNPGPDGKPVFGYIAQEKLTEKLKAGYKLAPKQ